MRWGAEGSDTSGVPGELWSMRSSRPLTWVLTAVAAVLQIELVTSLADSSPGVGGIEGLLTTRSGTLAVCISLFGLTCLAA